MDIIKMHCTNFKRYGEKRAITDSIEMHSIGCAQDEAEAIRNNMNQYSQDGIVNSIVDAKTAGKVVECLPLDNVTWADGGYGNSHSITIEIAESDTLRYKPNSADFTVTDETTFKKDILRGYLTAVEYVAKLCKERGINPLKQLSNGLYCVYSHKEANAKGLATAHVDPDHVWSRCGLSMDMFRNDVYALMSGSVSPSNGTQAREVNALSSEAEKARRLLSIVTPIAKSNGLFPSIATAQTILESGYCGTDLALNANNVCGMKCNLSGNTWGGTTWDGKRKYTKNTKEQTKDGVEYTVQADFRKYACIEDSIKDRCAYLLGAMNGNELRYAGIKDCATPEEQAKKIKAGGYATDINYVYKLMDICKRFSLFDNDNVEVVEEAKDYYRVGKDWKDGVCVGQIGAYLSEANAKKACLPGFVVYDPNGKAIYANVETYLDKLKAVCVSMDETMRRENAEGKQWKYYNNKAYAKTFALAIAQNKRWISCANGVCWALKQAGLMDANADNFYGQNGGIVWSEATKAEMQKHFTIVKANGRTVADCIKDGMIRGGTVVFYQTLTHTNLYIDGMWFDAGHANCSGCGEGAPFFRWLGNDTPYMGYKVSYVLQLNNNDCTRYRVQVGAFTFKKNASAVMTKVKKQTNFDCFIEQQADGYHVICGSFAVKANAEERAELLKLKGISAIIKEL